LKKAWKKLKRGFRKQDSQELNLRLRKEEERKYK